ncbi:MAG TPA: GNAT family N-acetyltransferase [Ktedonobacteraceae bacterium]|nr:GNAT family N-acetyltransferase [Ktedonobacteraceae bacterium]
MSTTNPAGNDRVVPLTLSHLKQAAAVLGRAFFADPLWQYLLPDDTRRAALLPSCFRLFVRYSLRYGECYTTTNLSAVACWLSPGNTTPTPGRLLLVAIHGAPLNFGWSALQRNNRVASYTEALHKQYAPDPHWYLWGLGVDPAYQGQGLGSMLIQAGLARADTRHYPCYLETMNERNVPFYQKHGFQVMSEGKAPGTELRIWSMLRKPQG